MISNLDSLTNGLSDDFYSTKDFQVSARDTSVPHAPCRPSMALLTPAQLRKCIENALRYHPPRHHRMLAKEFLEEMHLYGHIYMYRFRPTAYSMHAHSLSSYPAKCSQSAAIMLMIMNNLDPKVAQYPHELITYGGNGSVFQNWAQYHLTMKYLSQMTDQQTLTMYSGHPMGLFPSHIDAPRVVVTNGMVIPNYSSRNDYEVLYAQGNSQYGQMTAGSYCYIGPQGIVHGTTITLMNAARFYLGAKSHDDMRGRVFVTAGLGGMSGAQPKAGLIAGMVVVVAEIDPNAWQKRYEQGWFQHKAADLDTVIQLVKDARQKKQPCSIGFLGNIVDLLQRFVQEPENLVDLASDQTSLHNPYQGGYYPTNWSFEESRKKIVENPQEFQQAVQSTLRQHVSLINELCARGTKFWDYGNAFMLEASRASADIWKDESHAEFKYQSYFQAFMGDIFSLGFGPFRWVCLSGKHSDLQLTDALATKVLNELMESPSLDTRVRQQYQDNREWIMAVEDHKLVVGSEARILYSNSDGRVKIALAFNEAIAQGTLGPVMLSRDHHDVSGTDSPFRETSNITDGSMFCADMAVQNAIGDSFRGATSVSLHNGGGCGWGEVINGGFLLMLDGTADSARRAQQMLYWDVNNGVSRRSWSGNANAEFQIKEAMRQDPLLTVTVPEHADAAMLDEMLQ